MGNGERGGREDFLFLYKHAFYSIALHHELVVSHHIRPFLTPCPVI